MFIIFCGHSSLDFNFFFFLSWFKIPICRLCERLKHPVRKIIATVVVKTWFYRSLWYTLFHCTKESPTIEKKKNTKHIVVVVDKPAFGVTRFPDVSTTVQTWVKFPSKFSDHTFCDFEHDNDILNYYCRLPKIDSWTNRRVWRDLRVTHKRTDCTVRDTRSLARCRIIIPTTHPSRFLFYFFFHRVDTSSRKNTRHVGVEVPRDSTCNEMHTLGAIRKPNVCIE